MDDERGLPNNTINVLYEDEGGVMWIGTYKKSVAYYDEGIFKFGINHLGDINCLEESNDGSLWLGTNDAGLIRWNRRRMKETVCILTGRKLYCFECHCKFVASKGRQTLDRDILGRIGLFRRQSLRALPNRPGDDNSLANNNVWSLAEDKNGNIWIGTLGGGLQCLNPGTGEFTTYKISNSGIISNHIASLCMSRDNRLIIGTSSTGVSIMDLTTRKITNLVGNESGSIRFSNQSINQVYEDSRGIDMGGNT